MSLIEKMRLAAGHNAHIIDCDGKAWNGFVSGFNTDWDNEEDNALGYFSIDLDVKRDDKTIYYELREDEIESIEVVD